MAKNNVAKFKTKDNRIFEGGPKDGKVRVTYNRTARGQIFTAGVLDIDTGQWHNDENLPKDVREFFESKFAKKIEVFA